uniref:cytoskeleton-associated protein 2-like isoform X1 n=1 Tax=Jaculus jaculus TaxID=51337 RepID=UPI001E1B5757|nr:cytoskeleton-associated protein 2-like isoform X1 [Jaculus jaculus]
MVGPDHSTAAAAERQRKLQEYLAAKGKLKDQNTKPYLKAKNNCPNPPPARSTIGPKKDVTSHAILPVKVTRPVNIKLQSKTANITGPQKPKLEPEKLPGKKLASRSVPSNPNYKPPNKSRTGSSTAGTLSRKLTKSPSETTGWKKADQGNTLCTDSVMNTQIENKPSNGFLKEINKENLSQTLLEPERKTDSELYTISKPKTSCYVQTRGSLAPKQVFSKSSLTIAVLKDRGGKTHIRTLPVRSQQLSRVADFARPKEKTPRTVPSHFIQTVSRTQASMKPVAKDMKVNKNGRTNETKLQTYAVTEQKVKHTKTPHLLQESSNNRCAAIRPDQKTVLPCLRPQTSCVLQRSRAIIQKPILSGDRCNSVIPSTPRIREITTNNKYNNIFQQKPQTLDSKFKKALPHNHFLNKTAPKSQAGITTINKKAPPSGTQTHPNINKKTTAEDRRKQLEEWQKSKGKIYKRPPMEVKAKRKIIEEMNISFWKSIEKEEEEKKAQLELSNKINNTLTECLQLIEEGVLSSEIFTILSSIPEAEKFAKFWICKAKLLASKGTFDVIGLYEEAIKNGATPILELREVVLNILQDPSRTTEGISSSSLADETNIVLMEELARSVESVHSCRPLKEREQVAAIPQITTTEQDNPGIKLQITPIPRISGMPEVQDMKLITPVRRSARIKQAVSHYPEMLQEHDLVVASLDELLEVETECFLVRKNEALPVMLGFKVLES